MPKQSEARLQKRENVKDGAALRIDRSITEGLKNFGAQLRAQRKSRGLTQQEMEKRSGSPARLWQLTISVRQAPLYLRSMQNTASILPGTLLLILRVYNRKATRRKIVLASYYDLRHVSGVRQKAMTIPLPAETVLARTKYVAAQLAAYRAGRLSHFDQLLTYTGIIGWMDLCSNVDREIYRGLARDWKQSGAAA